VRGITKAATDTDALQDPIAVDTPATTRSRHVSASCPSAPVPVRTMRYEVAVVRPDAMLIE